MSAALRRTAGWPAAAVLVAAVILVVGIGQTSAGHAALRAAGLYSAAGGYTALSFVHPQSLPHPQTPKLAKLDVAFAIQNANGNSRDYQWSVFLVQAGHSQRMAAGRVTVAAGHQAAITRLVSCTGSRARVVVRLARPAEAIDVRATCQSAGAR